MKDNKKTNIVKMKTSFESKNLVHTKKLRLSLGLDFCNLFKVVL